MLGQRGPSTAVALVWIGWLCRARRTLDPLIRFGVALLLLNVSVGVVKIGTGRWGPRITSHARDVLAGGDIFPSGHVSNAVVLFGVLAALATRHRRAMTALAIWVSVTVGLSTLYLDTHWVTDILGGWIAGVLVLMILPSGVRLLETRLDKAHRVIRQLAAQNTKSTANDANEFGRRSRSKHSRQRSGQSEHLAFDQIVRQTAGTPRVAIPDDCARDLRRKFSSDAAPDIHLQSRPATTFEPAPVDA